MRSDASYSHSHPDAIDRLGRCTARARLLLSPLSGQETKRPTAVAAGGLHSMLLDGTICAEPCALPVPCWHVRL